MIGQMIDRAKHRLIVYHRSTHGKQIEDQYLRTDIVSRRGMELAGSTIFRDMNFRLSGWRGRI